MSQDEQDQIFGRLTRELGEARRKIAALEADLAQSADYLNTTASELGAFSEHGIRLDMEFLQRFDKNALLQKIEDLRSERTKIDGLRSKLQKFEGQLT